MLSSSQQPDQFDLPPELTSKPLALIGFSGLDSVNNAIHKTIWCDFRTNDKMQRVPIQFKLLNNAHEFPVLKPKRNSYEWYIPKGILKRNWMNKHLNEIPAVIVIFYDLDWNDANWNEKLIEISSRVQSMRAAVEGRNTRVVVVLIQQIAPLPASEDVLASERATALCASCELNSEHLFVLLPHDHHLVGYISRLENAFYDLAQGYYSQEVRNVKSHRDYLNKTTHQYLFVRHEFKMGFLCELKQDHHTAVKHYTHAYNNLQEIRMVDTNALEIRTIAGFINYKLCRLLFTLRLRRDAILQFKAHIDRYKARSGFKELTFEHHAWLSKQYSSFGDLFYEVIHLFPVAQTQHPGFYYQQAANQAILRKKACYELCPPDLKYPSPDPLESSNRLEHYGQRPWRAGRLSAEPLDPALEQAAIEALQWKERHTVNHSSIIINLYGSAILHFKANKCPRMRSAVVVQMADEYCSSNDFGKALTLLTHMLWDYRSEKWFSIVANLLKKAINCAHLTASIQEFVTFSLEALSNSINLSIDYKERVYNNLMKVLTKTVPEIDAETLLPLNPNAHQLWSTVNINPEPQAIAIEMNNISLFLQAKVRFLNTSYHVNETVDVEILCRSCTSLKLNFLTASLLINSSNSYNKEIPITTPNNSNIILEPNETKKFLVQYNPDMTDAGKEIQICAILFYLGSRNGRQAVLKFCGLGNEIYMSDFTYPEFQCLYDRSKNASVFFDTKPCTVTFIKQRPSKLELNAEHEPPSLTEEWYPIVLHVKNVEEQEIIDLKIEIIKKCDYAPAKCVLTTDYNNEDKVPPIYEYKIVAKNETKNIKLYLRTQEATEANIFVRMTYFITLPEGQLCPCLKEDNIIIRSIKPFDFECKFFTKYFDKGFQLYLNETFFIRPLITNITPWPILIEKAHIETTNSSINITKDHSHHVKNVTLINDGGELTHLYSAIIPKTNKTIHLNSIGDYTVSWKRKGSKTCINSTKFTISLNSIGPIRELPLKVELCIDAFGIVLKPLPTTYRLFNNTTDIIILELIMEASDAFMFAGHKQKQISILPESEFVVKYTLYPLIAGKVNLPKLQLSIPEQFKIQSVTQNDLTEVLSRSLQNEIHVFPQIRGNPKPIEILY